MKQYSLKKLTAESPEIFEMLGVDKVYATSDGQYFKEENRALLHATPNRLRVFTIVKGEQPLVIGSEDGTKAADVETEETATSPSGDDAGKAQPSHPVDTHGDEDVKTGKVKKPKKKKK